MAIRTTLEEIRVNTPNIFTGAEHAAIVFFAYLALFVPKYGQVAHNLLMEVGEQITLDSQEREAKQRENIVKFKERDRLAAHAAAEKQKEIDAKDKEIDITEAQTRTDHTLSQAETKAALDILRAKEQGKTTEITADTQQTIERVQEETQHHVTELETSHQIKLFSQLHQHVDKMTTLQLESTHTTDALNTAIDRNTAANIASQKSIMNLNRAMESNKKATHLLLTTLNNFDSIVRSGKLDTAKEKIMHTILMDAMEADVRLETTIATANLQQNTELEQAFKADVADKNRHLEQVLASCATETLAKLASLIESDIHTSQQAITTCTTQKAKTVCQTRLDTLLAMQQTMQIQIEKGNSAQTAVRPKTG